MLLLPLESLFRDVIFMMIFRIATEYYPGRVDIDISVQVHLILKFIYIDSVHSDNISNPEYTRKFFNVLGEELKADVSH
jgi:hypothetical protein